MRLQSIEPQENHSHDPDFAAGLRRHEGSIEEMNLLLIAFRLNLKVPT